MRTRIRDLQSATAEVQKLGTRPWFRLRLEVVALVAIIGFAFPPTGFAGKSDPKATPDPVIKILVYNLAQAPRAVLTEAQREAGGILSKAGVRASWFECPAGDSDAELQDICQNGWGATNSIGLRILATPMAFENRFQGDHLGFAVFPALASVYYDHRLRFVADDVGLGLPRILGCFIAHEIGHLLLGSNSHSNQGLMQAAWGERQIHQALAGDLLFTSNQAKLMQTEARTRMSLQTGTHAQSGNLKLRFDVPFPFTVDNTTFAAAESEITEPAHTGCSSYVTYRTRQRHSGMLSLPIRERKGTQLEDWPAHSSKSELRNT